MRCASRQPGRQRPDPRNLLPVDGNRARTVELYLLRHAHAGDALKWRGPDERRPLSGKGEAQVERLAKLLKNNGFSPEAVISSPKLRAVETAEPVAVALGLELRVDARLGQPLGLDELEAVLDDAGKPARVVLVGHDPDFSALVAVLCHVPSVPVRKGALVRIDSERPLCPGCGTLRWLVPPELLPRA